MAKKIIAGNWKMNPGSMREAERLFSSITKMLTSAKNTEIIVCPPFPYIEKLKKISKKVILGAQDVSFEQSGPFTGEISGEMLESLGVKYVIIGHSERRALGETNSVINKKVKAALKAGLTPILCVGEVLRDTDHSYFNTVRQDLEESLEGISRNLISKIVVAYEPVWAISTTVGRRDATPEDALEMVIFIRKTLSIKFSEESGKVRILYGGSVNEKDAESFLRDGGVDGLLVGKASLDPEKFIQITRICEASNK